MIFPKDKIYRLIKMKVTRPKEVMGLDIGSYSIKSCLVKSQDHTKELLDFRIVPIKNLEIKEAIKEAIAIAKEKVHSLNITAGLEGVVTRQVIFPKMSQNELNSALKFEAEKYIPFKPSEVVMDFQILKQDIEPGKMLLLLAAAKKEIIERHLTLIKEVGFKVDIIDVDILSLANAFGYFSSSTIDKKVSALLNIGHSASSLLILKDGLPYITRDIFIAGRDLTKQISDGLNIDLSQAEALKSNPGARSQEVERICEPILNKFCSQLGMSFDYFESQTGLNPEEVYLSGGTAGFTGMSKFLENDLGVKIHFWDNLSNLNLNSSLDEKRFKESIPNLMVALGLTLR